MKHKKMSENFVNQWLQAYDKVDMNVDSWRVALKLKNISGSGTYNATLSTYKTETQHKKIFLSRHKYEQCTIYVFTKELLIYLN